LAVPFVVVLFVIVQVIGTPSSTCHIGADG
jgi:hypothetical protein